MGKISIILGSQNGSDLFIYLMAQIISIHVLDGGNHCTRRKTHTALGEIGSDSDAVRQPFIVMLESSKPLAVRVIWTPNGFGVLIVVALNKLIIGRFSLVVR